VTRSMLSSWLLFASGLLLLPAVAQASEPPTPAAAPQKAVLDGIAVELSVTPADGGSGPVREGQPARVRLAFTDAATKTPLSRLAPGAWMDLLGTGSAGGTDAKAAAPPGGCKQKVETFVGGSIFSRPELDLNTYYVLALNEDATISVVDPLFGYGGSKLLALVFLDSPGEDWALTPDGDRLFVSMPDTNRVAVVESATWKVVLGIDTPARPRRLGLQPDGQYLWVAHDGGVSAIDVRSLRKVADIPTGPGGHDLAFSDDSRFAFVTNEAAGTVSVLDTGKLAKLRDIKAGSRPVSLAWSTQAKAVYVASADGVLTAVDGIKAQPLARIQGEPGLGRIRFAPGGRLAFVVSPDRDAVHIVDAASNRIVQTADVEDGPDQVAFSDELAYVRHRGSETVLMIPLKTVGEAGKPVPVVDFPGGQHPPGRLPRPTPADGIVQSPGAPAVLVANPEDEVIYFYKEGMAAPMGHFKNYGKQPRAVLVVDRSLREVRPGVYETIARMGPAGDYDLALFVAAPRLVQCFPVKVAEDPVLVAQRNKRPLDVDIQAEPREPTAGQDVRVRLRLTDPQTGAPKTGLTDVRVLTFLAPGIWQQRQWATERGEGLYEITFQPREEGLYYVFVEVPSAGLQLRKSPYLTLVAGPAPAVPGGTR
jgi:DNA-binding beta-propeller fold protein YncE